MLIGIYAFVLVLLWVRFVGFMLVYFVGVVGLVVCFLFWGMFYGVVYELLWGYVFYC